MHISSLSVQNWKNFKRASAKLSRRTFLIGPNASGKSNLLDSLRFLRDLGQRGLEYAVELRGGVSLIRCLAARESPSIRVEVVIRDVEDRDRWRYLVEFNQDASRVPVVRRELVEDLVSGKMIIERPDKADDRDPLLLTQTALEQIAANREFRPVAEFLSSISYQHLVPQVVRDPKGFSSAPIKNDPYGRDLLLRIRNTPANTRDAWLRRSCIALRHAVPQLQSLEIELDDEGRTHLVGRHEHWRPHDAKLSENQFSDGTLRLFGLIWSLFEGSGPLLLEEPELSLHPEVVRHIPELFFRVQEEIRRMRRGKGVETRQIVMSTHSEEMLRDRSISAGEVLVLEPGHEGSTISQASSEDEELLRQGLTVADVLLPRTAPGNGQLHFSFTE